MQGRIAGCGEVETASEDRERPAGARLTGLKQAGQHDASAIGQPEGVVRTLAIDQAGFPLQD